MFEGFKAKIAAKYERQLYNRVILRENTGTYNAVILGKQARSISR